MKKEEQTISNKVKRKEFHLPRHIIDEFQSRFLFFA